MGLERGGQTNLRIIPQLILIQFSDPQCYDILIILTSVHTKVLRKNV